MGNVETHGRHDGHCTENGRRRSLIGRRKSCHCSVVHPPETIGPVDITKQTNENNSKLSTRILATGSALSKNVLSLRPRTPIIHMGSYRRRPRRSTIGCGSRAQDLEPIVQPATHASRHRSISESITSSPESSTLQLQFPSSVIDDVTTAFLASCSEKEGATKKLPTIFRYDGDAKEVYISGTFNNWKKMKMSRSNKDFVAIVDLKEGEHEYKFVVDGKWINDPNASIKEAKDKNGFTVKNSVIRCQKEDFDAYNALDMDGKAVELAKAAHRKDSYSDTFSQEIPDYIIEKSHIPGTGPPIIPPHLFQLILNQDTLLSCEPEILPEPNHVMLNHLYALSITDDVMILGTTQRYKRKCITTLMYTTIGARTN